jgi:hypothetical protein
LTYRIEKGDNIKKMSSSMEVGVPGFPGIESEVARRQRRTAGINVIQP